MLKFLSLLLALSFCQGLQHNNIDDYVEAEPVFEASKYGSLWPLPQKVQISEVSFKLTSSTFRIVDAKASSAGPSCSLLQSAYRRWAAVFISCFYIYLFKSLHIIYICGEISTPQPVLRSGASFHPRAVSLCRYYEYMFGSAKKQWWSKNNRRSDPSDLSELQVWITSPDSECDGYPSVTSDESCEYLPFLVHVMFNGGIQSGASFSAIPCSKL